MFTPIKNFITYIQNAGGNGMFGSPTTTSITTTTTTASTTTTTTPIKISVGPTLAIKEKTPILPFAERSKLPQIKRKMEEENFIKLTNPQEHIIHVSLEHDHPTKITTTTCHSNNNALVLSNGSDDDIELQIKSSIMVKPSVIEKPVTASHSNGLRHTRTIMRRPSISGPGPMIKEEPMKFIPPLGLGKIVDRDKSTCSKMTNGVVPTSVAKTVAVEEVVKADSHEIPQTVDVLNTSLESTLEDDSFLEVSLPELPNSEIIVLNCLETSSPTISATPTDDPLASDSSFTALDNHHDISASLNGSFNSTDEIHIEIEEAPATHDHVNAEAEGDIMPVYWHTVEAEAAVESGTVDVCDANNFSVDEASCSLQVKPMANNDTSITGPAIIETTRQEHLEEVRNEGSDSGLGVEAAQVTKLKEVPASEPPPLTNCQQEFHATSSTTAFCTATVTTTTTSSSNSTLAFDSAFVPHLSRRPLRSNLKRRLEVAESSQTATNTSDGQHNLVEKRSKRSINFDSVKVYYFSRQQGFSCVPSAGGCTLGMSSQHIGFKTMTLAEHAAELRRAHRMQSQENNQRSSSSDDSEESEEDFLSEGSGSDLDGDNNGFLQPVTPKQRRAILKAAGVRKIDANEKSECRDIRNSREVCGCTCRDFCDPETCACSQAGIKCQVDRAMFPCGCSRDACGNNVGRVEFNPARVRTHFIHTIMRLEMENRQQQQPHVNHNNNTNLNNNNNSNNLNNYAHMSPAHYYNAQTQSNYSSGYASPAYSTEHAIGGGSQSPANYYAHQTQDQHYMGGSSEEMHNQAPNNNNRYQMDALDSTGLYTHNTIVHSTPTYGDISSPVPATPYANNALYNDTPNFGESMASRTTLPYGSCFMPQSNHNYTSERNPAPQQANNFTSLTNAASSPICNFVCSPANTVTDTGHSNGSYANDEIIADTGSASFINLSSPVANATRLSQINDMLQQNRHTTATLVAVTPTEISTPFHSIASSPSPSPNSSTTISVEQDDTSNISVMHNISEENLSHDHRAAVVSSYSHTISRLPPGDPANSKEKHGIGISKAADSSSSVIVTCKDPSLQ